MQVWWLRKIHVSWLIGGWCLGVIIGVVMAAVLPYGWFSSLGWLLLGLALLTPILKDRLVWMLVLTLCSGVMIGLWRGGVGQVGLEYYNEIIGHEVVLSGKIKEDPDIDRRGQTVLRLTNIALDGNYLPGSMWVVTDKNDVLRRSDLVTVRGQAAEGFSTFAISMRKAEVLSVERPVPGDVAVEVRDWFAQRVRLYIDEPQADLGLGFLLGLRRALPVDLMDALQIAGLTHVIVASGYNLTILVRLSRRLFVRVSRYLSVLSSGAMVLAFMAVTGLSPSMSRAGLVAGLSLLTWYYGRKIHPFVLLSFVAAVTLFINPQYGWGDVGWLLSFASFVGVIVLAPLLQSYFFGDKKPSTVRQIFGETVSAQVMTAPMIIMTFGVFSNVALIANLLILPLVPLAMLLVFLVGVFSGVPYIAEILAAPTSWLLSYMVRVAEWLSSLEMAQTEVSLGWLGVSVAYCTLALAMWWMWRKTKLNLRDVNIVE